MSAVEKAAPAVTTPAIGQAYGGGCACIPGRGTLYAAIKEAILDGTLTYTPKEAA